MMQIVFRADASLIIGTGHLMRCLTLADALRERGAWASFVCREYRGHLCDLVEERGFALIRLPVSEALGSAEDISRHAARLGDSWQQEDANQTRAAIEAMGAKPDWLAVDQYTLDHHYERALRTSVGRIMVIDDLADRSHECDLLLDQNLVAEMHTRYADKVPAACRMLLGPEYALLQPIYAELHDRTPPRAGPIQRIFIFFGGADSDNLTGHSLSAFLALNRPDIGVDVVVNANDPNAEAIRRQVAGHDNILVHCALPTLARLMARADLAIGAAGVTSWERLCLGLPSLVVTLAENQRQVAAELHRLGLIHWVGHKDEVVGSGIERALRELISRAQSRSGLKCSQVVVDGRGVNRVCDFLREMMIPDGPTISSAAVGCDCSNSGASIGESRRHGNRRDS